MKKILLTMMVAMLLMTWCVAGAAPAKPGMMQHVQSDGSTVTLMMRGGELHRSLVTTDGLTVARAASGDYCYVASGVMSDVMAHNVGLRGVEETAFVAAYREQMTRDDGGRRAPRREGENDNPQVPTMGSPRIPVILVNYTDLSFKSDDPVVTFQNQFNEQEKSCLHYFQSQSRGMFSPQFDILGPVNLPQTREYYGGNIRIYGTEVDQQLGTMIYDACTGLGSGVNFSDYDNDGDGIVDVVVVLYAGVGEAQAWRTVPESVWPSQWDMQESLDWGCSTIGPFQLDGVTINKYAVFNELEGPYDTTGQIDGIGTFCHEFGHCLGLPDFYPTNGGNYYGMSSWDIMDNGCYADDGHTPVGYTSYERHFMGWMDLIEPRENTRYALKPLNTDAGTAVKVTNDANPDEYYLIEYRTKTGWDAYLAAEGLMILHVDYDKTIWENNTPNNVGNHQRMTLIPADGVLSNSSNKYDLWPQGDKNALTDESTPAATVYYGGLMHKPITGMSISDDKSTASLGYMMRESTPGDANQDGDVTIADVNTVIDAILSGSGDADTLKYCDINEDGEVSIADVVMIIEIILAL